MAGLGATIPLFGRCVFLDASLLAIHGRQKAVLRHPGAGTVAPRLILGLFKQVCMSECRLFLRIY